MDGFASDLASYESLSQQRQPEASLFTRSGTIFLTSMRRGQYINNYRPSQLKQPLSMRELFLPVTAQQSDSCWLVAMNSGSSSSGTSSEDDEEGGVMLEEEGGVMIDEGHAQVSDEEFASLKAHGSEGCGLGLVLLVHPLT